MECLQNRVDSFSKSKRVKNPNKPSSNITLKWPHPPSFLANPDTLAEAGFFFDPSAEDPDNVSCFICDKQLGGWEAEDDPFDIHYEKCAHKCSWANIRCGLRHDMDRHGRFVFPDKSRMPTSKAMEKARLQTFAVGDGWIHDKVRGHGASSKKLAKAGLIRTPNNPDDDTATCLYCNLSLSGWDKDDDPMEEHRKRKDKSGYPCPFFQPIGEPASSDSGQSSIKPALRASTSKPPSSRSTSKSKQHQDTVMPTKTHDGDSDEPDHASETKTPARKSRSAASGSSRKSTAKTPRVRGASKASLKEVVEAEEDEEDVAPPATVKKAKRTTPKSRAKSIAPCKDDDVEEPPATLKRKGTRSKSVARSITSEVEDEPTVAPPTTAKKKKAKAARSRSKSVAPSEKTEQSDLDSEALIVEETAKKPSRSKGKAKAPAPPETEEDVEEEPVPRNSSRAKNKGAPATVKKASSKSKSKAKVAEPKSEPEDEDLEEEQETAEEEPEPSRPRTTRKPPSTSSKATKSRSKPTQQQDDSEEVSEDEFGPVIEQPHFAPAAAAKVRSSSKPPSTAKKQPLAGASSLGKGKPPLRAKLPSTPPVQPPSSIDDEDELGGYSSAPSSPPPPPPPPAAAVIPEPNDEEEDMEMTPLVIPKRTTKPSQSATREIPEAAREQSESSSDTVKSTAKAKAVAKSVRPSQAGKPAAEKVRASITKVQDTSRMKVVDVLSSDDDFDDAMDALLLPNSPPEVAPEPPVEEEVRVDLQAKTKGKGKKGAAQAKKSLMFTASSALSEEPMQLTAPVRSTAQTPALSRAFDEPRSPEPQEENAVEGDVSMQAIPHMSDEGTDPAGMDQDTKMGDPILPAIETPRTPPQPESSVPDHPTRNATPPPSHKPLAPPPRSNDKEKFQGPPEVREQERQPPQEPAFFPPLSKLPFVPIQELTEAELDMTVEEWIRYQMEVEYDKFRRDGERELQRFRKRAEEARKIIEGL